MTKVSLGQAARIAGMSKSTLQRMLASGRVTGHQREDRVWEIDMSEVQRLMDSRDKPQRGRKSKVSAPVEDVRPEAIEIAELRANLAAVRQRLDDTIARAEAAEARAEAALARERELADREIRLIEDKRKAEQGAEAVREQVDRLARLIEDQRPRGLWSRLTGR